MRKLSLPFVTVTTILALVSLGATAHARQETLVFTGATVIDGTGAQPVLNATIVVVDGKIARIGTGAVSQDGRRVNLDGRYVMPGLIDAHVHINNFAAARRALMSGVTTARSMGTGFFADVGLRDLSKKGRIDAPELLAAGYHVRPEPADGLFIDDPSLSDLMETGVRDAAALRRVARAMISRGVDFIKTNATARAGLPNTDPREPFYDEALLRVLVEEAGNAGIPVAAHAHGDTGGRAAVLAGVRSIEHGTYLSEETLRLMRERGTYLVPTIAVVRDLTLPPEGTLYAMPQLEPSPAGSASSSTCRTSAWVADESTATTATFKRRLNDIVTSPLPPEEAARFRPNLSAESVVATSPPCDRTSGHTQLVSLAARPSMCHPEGWPRSPHQGRFMPPIHPQVKDQMASLWTRYLGISAKPS